MLEHWKRVRPKAILLEEFLDFLSQEGFEIEPREFSEEFLQKYPTIDSSKRLISKFLNVDEKQLEKERRLLLDSLKE